MTQVLHHLDLNVRDLARSEAFYQGLLGRFGLRELQQSERSREDLLRDSRERLVQVIDTVPAMISAADHDGHCIFVNANKAAFYGVDPASAIGRSGDEIFGKEHTASNRMHCPRGDQNDLARPCLNFD